MKTSLSCLLLLSAGLASAQFGAGRRDDPRPDARARFEGIYRSVQRDRTIWRTLRLERDGRAEIVTEFRGKNPEKDRRNGGVDLSDRDTEKYGRIAERAARGRAVRHSGRWEVRNRNLYLRLDSLAANVSGGDRSEFELEREDGMLVVHKDTGLYGKEKIEFRREGGWGGWNGGRDDGPGRGSRLGALRYDGDETPIDDVDLVDGRDGDARLIVRTATRRLEFRGTLLRQGDRAVFRVAGDREDRGEYVLQTRNGRVESISGSGSLDRRRIEFVENRRD